jgi:hypothetical protein
MKRKSNVVQRMRISKRSQQKLLERSAALYGRALERWNSRPLRGL